MASPSRTPTRSWCWAGALLPEDISLKAVGSHILVEHPNLDSPLSIEGLTLHFGLVLLAVLVLVLAAVGIGAVARVGWLIGMEAGAFVAHVIGVVLLARGVAWAAGSTSPESSSTLVFSLFAVFWGLLPPVVGGAWCFLYWLPRARAAAAQDTVTRP